MDITIQKLQESNKADEASKKLLLANKSLKGENLTEAGNEVLALSVKSNIAESNLIKRNVKLVQENIKNITNTLSNINKTLNVIEHSDSTKEENDNYTKNIDNVNSSIDDIIEETRKTKKELTEKYIPLNEELEKTRIEQRNRTNFLTSNIGAAFNTIKTSIQKFKPQNLSPLAWFTKFIFSPAGIIFAYFIGKWFKVNIWDKYAAPVFSWFNKNIKPIGDWLYDFYLNVLKPFINNTFIPFWDKTLQPALKTIYDHFMKFTSWFTGESAKMWSDVVSPWIRDTLKPFWEKTVIPVLNDMWNVTKWYVGNNFKMWSEVIIPWMRDSLMPWIRENAWIGKSIGWLTDMSMKMTKFLFFGPIIEFAKLLPIFSKFFSKAGKWLGLKPEENVPINEKFNTQDTYKQYVERSKS